MSWITHGRKYESGKWELKIQFSWASAFGHWDITCAVHDKAGDTTLQGIFKDSMVGLGNFLLFGAIEAIYIQKTLGKSVRRAWGKQRQGKCKWWWFGCGIKMNWCVISSF